MNDREKLERLREAPESHSVRLVLAIVLMSQRSGWCDLSRVEIAELAGVSPETVKRAIWELVPDQLERRLIRGRPSLLKPATRVTRDPTVGSSTKGGRRVTRDPTHIGAVSRALTPDEIRIREAADLDRLVRGTNVVPISRKNSSSSPPVRSNGGR